MDKTVFKKALYESLQRGEYLEEAVGSATFGGLLDSKEIKNIGDKLKRANIALGKLKFRKAQPKQFRFSAPRKRFVFKSDSLTNVVVCINEEMGQYAAFELCYFDMRSGDSNRHYLVAHNIEDLKVKMNFNPSVGVLTTDELTTIQTLVNARDTVIYYAELKDEDFVNFREISNVRWNNRHNKDKLLAKNKALHLKSEMFKMPKVKELRDLMKTVGYKLKYLFAYDDIIYNIYFDFENEDKKFIHGPQLYYKKGYGHRIRTEGLDDLVFSNLALDMGWSNQTYTGEDIDEVVERIQNIKKIIDCMK